MENKKVRGKHWISLSFLWSFIIAFVITIFKIRQGSSFSEIMVSILVLGMFLIHPIILTLLNLYFLFSKNQDVKLRRKGNHIAYLTLILGTIYSMLLFSFLEVTYRDWTVTLTNSQKHTPIWTGGGLTVLVLALVGICGYAFLSTVRISKAPPLLLVLAISAMYLGMAMCILWVIQIFSGKMIMLCLLPINILMIGAKTIRLKITQWMEEGPEVEKGFQNKYLNWLNQKLIKAETWPVAAFLLMWPLLGIIICILVLFGQRPDSVIKAWTETSDWNLSTQVSPQNVFYDEHYLCTVAAGGHRCIVNPQRMGERHGHRVIVNRQLCIANAFEQILEERIPRLHKPIRHFYDNYGFPIARLIHSPFVADIIYLLMKPLEWFFLMVLYLCDVKPENRIAVQYLGRQ